jgi:hypothetical protein
LGRSAPVTSTPSAQVEPDADEQDDAVGAKDEGDRREDRSPQGRQQDQRDPGDGRGVQRVEERESGDPGRQGGGHDDIMGRR